MLSDVRGSTTEILGHAMDRMLVIGTPEPSGRRDHPSPIRRYIAMFASPTIDGVSPVVDVESLNW
jgi:hypothetical protein